MMHAVDSPNGSFDAQEPFLSDQKKDKEISSLSCLSCCCILGFGTIVAIGTGTGSLLGFTAAHTLSVTQTTGVLFGGTVGAFFSSLAAGAIHVLNLKEENKPSCRLKLIEE